MEKKCNVDAVTFEIKGITPAEVFSLSRSYTIDYVRMDCGGCELEVIENFNDFDLFLFDRIPTATGKSYPAAWKIYLQSEETVSNIKQQFCDH